MKMATNQFPNNKDIDSGCKNEFLSPRQLAMRWDCSRTTAQRIADRVGIPKYYLGEGKNGLVRYAMQDIESYEVSRRTPVNLRP